MTEQPTNPDFVPLEALTGARPSPKYWRSMDELEGTAASDHLLNTEFPEGADEEPQGASRRRFLSLMAGSMALAGLTGCTRQPTEMIMPYVDPPSTPSRGSRCITRPPFPSTASQKA